MVMSRKRELPPEIFLDERLALLPDRTRLTAIGLRANADNWGRESANPTLVKAAVWPLHQNVTVEHVFDDLVTLRDVGYIYLYEDGPRWVYAIVDWPAVSHRTDSKCRFPAPPDEPTSLPEGFQAGEEEKWRELASEGEPASGNHPDIPPSRYCPKHRPNGTFAPCGPCATARERFERWQDAAYAAENARVRFE